MALRDPGIGDLGKRRRRWDTSTRATSASGCTCAGDPERAVPARAIPVPLPQSRGVGAHPAARPCIAAPAQPRLAGFRAIMLAWNYGISGIVI